MLRKYFIRISVQLKRNFADDDGEWGNIYENATGDGVLGAVAERRADIGFTALYSW